MLFFSQSQQKSQLQDAPSFKPLYMLQFISEGKKTQAEQLCRTILALALQNSTHRYDETWMS